jgi:hypothetical protein
MFPKPFTAGASITGGYGLRFRKVGLLTCRHPSPRCLLGIPTRHSISRVEVQWQTSFGKLILEGGNVGAAQGFFERILGEDPWSFTDDLQRPDRPGVSPEFPVV